MSSEKAVVVAAAAVAPNAIGIQQFLTLALESPRSHPDAPTVASDASADRMLRRPAIAFSSSAGESQAPLRSTLYVCVCVPTVQIFRRIYGLALVGFLERLSFCSVCVCVCVLTRISILLSR